MNPKIRAAFQGALQVLPLRGIWASVLLLTGMLVSSTAVRAAEVSSPVQVTVVSDHDAAVPGQTVRLGVQLKLAPGWHVYYKEPGDAGRATTVELADPKLGTGPLQWERPRTFQDSGFTTFGYQDATVVALPVEIPATAAAGDKLVLRLKVTWLACHDECQPGETEVVVTLPVVAAGTAVSQSQQGAFAGVGFSGDPAAVTTTPQQPAAQTSLLWALVCAFMGGMLLNLMPCVLPVLSLKIMGFVKQSGQNRKRILALGLAYTAGTLATFLVLAAAVIGMQAAGYSVGWGFQFQQPLFVIAMITLVTVMSLPLFGVFYVSFNGGSQLNKMADQEGMGGAFFKGVSATILSTPCTAPALGTALGFAFSQPAWVVLLIFSVTGLGMSLPYLLLSANPGWMRFLPKPGEWMETFKQGMGFLMLASAAWLLWVLGRQGGSDLVCATLAFLLVVSFGMWCVGRFAGFDASRRRSLIVWALVLALSAGGFTWFVQPALKKAAAGRTETAQIVDGVLWEPYSQAALDRHLAAGKIVMVDFTADWCLTCKVNEQVLTSAVVTEKMRQSNVVVLRADWTGGNPEITKLLAGFGRSGVPLYVIYSQGKAPIVLPELITTTTVVDALNSASK